MISFGLEIKNEVFDDIQNGIDYYNSKQRGLGKRFFNAIQQEFKVLIKNPMFQVRYEKVRCLPLKKFPYMIHFIVVEEAKKIVVLGVINTNQDPDKWISRLESDDVV